jgi:heme-degrading monooxygenase HmoA
MIARIWRGKTARADRDAYRGYLRQTGLRDYLATPGNQGAYVLWREVGDQAEFVTISFWETEAAIAGFAGEPISRAVFYPEDDKYLIDRDYEVSHYHVDA